MLHNVDLPILETQGLVGLQARTTKTVGLDENGFVRSRRGGMYQSTSCGTDFFTA